MSDGALVKNEETHMRSAGGTSGGGASQMLACPDVSTRKQHCNKTMRLVVYGLHHDILLPVRATLKGKCCVKNIARNQQSCRA